MLSCYEMKYGSKGRLDGKVSLEKGSCLILFVYKHPTIPFGFKKLAFFRQCPRIGEKTNFIRINMLIVCIILSIKFLWKHAVVLPPFKLWLLSR